MAELAAHLTDHVLPHLAVRQWVLSLPKRLRPFLHHNPDLAGAVLRIFLRAIRTTLRHASPGAPAHAQLGAVSFLHRFGSSLNPHLHFHVVVLDGVPPALLCPAALRPRAPSCPRRRRLPRLSRRAPSVSVSQTHPGGRTEIVLSPLQLLERLVAFAPPPRMHRHRYHGVLAPHAGLRAAVVALGRAPAKTPRLVDAETLRPVPRDLDELPRSASPARIRWAVLLARIYEVLPLLCPACGGSMKILAFLTDPPVLSAILVHLESGPPRNACCVG